MKQMARGQGSVFQIDNGKWVWQGYYVDKYGKTKRPKRTFNTKVEALKFQAEQLEKLEVERRKKQEGYTVEDVYKMYLQDFENGKIDIAVSTINRTKGNYNKHILPRFADKKLLCITKDDIEQFVESLKKVVDNKDNEVERKDKTIKNIYDDFKKIFNYAYDKDYIFENVASSVKVKAGTRKKVVNIISEKEYQMLLECEKNKKSFYYPIVWFLGETGLRFEELGFFCSDIVELDSKITSRCVYINKSIENGRIIYSTKTIESERRVPLSNAAEFALSMYESIAKRQIDMKKNECYFLSSANTILNYRNVLRAYHKMLENVGLEQKGLHSLRKRFIRHSLNEGLDKFEVAKILGHSQQTMFKSYFDLDDSWLSKMSQKL